MDYNFTPTDLFARVGTDSMKVQAAEQRVAVLEVALQMAVGNLEVGAEGISADLIAAASAELDRLKEATAPSLESDS